MCVPCLKLHLSLSYFLFYGCKLNISVWKRNGAFKETQTGFVEKTRSNDRKAPLGPSLGLRAPVEWAKRPSQQVII